MRYLLPESGHFYKANLHAHSTLSDGHFTPEELKALYQAAGYSVLALTDHRRCIPHPELCGPDFLALTGYELDFSARDESGMVRHTTHLNAYPRAQDAVRADDTLPLTYAMVNAKMAELDRAGFLTTVNHPVWSDMSTEDVLSLHGMTGVEVYNSIAVQLNGYSDDSSYYEHFIRAGRRAVPVAADDCHLAAADGAPTGEYFQGFNVFRAPELTSEAILGAFERGEGFASTGPMFRNLALDGGTLLIECSPVCGVFVRTKYIHHKSWRLEREDSITRAEIDVSDLLRRSPYLWVEIRDVSGRTAWSTPCWID